MTKVVKALAASGFAVLAVALLGIAMSSSAETASAQTPPAAPSAFYGDVSVDGAPVAKGTLIEAVVNGSVCGDGRTGDPGTGGDDNYAIQVRAFDPQGLNGEDCGSTGDTVIFYIGGVAGGKVGGTGVWNSSTAQRVNLSYTTPTVAPTTSGTPGTGTPGAGTATSTPKAPTTGAGLDTGDSGSATWLYVALGLGAVAFGASGVAVARKSR
ncbi:MAG TPA: hypothetical protein VFK32_08615 [Tepidiformaceae bacterium]|nr:hypothetical protein [Tepidiformaceae bacterium]